MKVFSFPTSENVGVYMCRVVAIEEEFLPVQVSFTSVMFWKNVVVEEGVHEEEDNSRNYRQSCFHLVLVVFSL